MRVIENPYSRIFYVVSNAYDKVDPEMLILMFQNGHINLINLGFHAIVYTMYQKNSNAKEIWITI